MIDTFLAIPDLPAEARSALQAMADLRRRIDELETERRRLEEQIRTSSGVKLLGAKNQLAQLPTSPLADNVTRALNSAAARFRTARAQTGDVPTADIVAGADIPHTLQGALGWMAAELRDKQARYGGR